MAKDGTLPEYGQGPPDAADGGAPASAQSATDDVQHAAGGERPRKRRLISPISLHILAINMLALSILVAGVLYLGDYRQSLIRAELAALRTQAQLFAVALAEGAMHLDQSSEQQVATNIRNQMLRRLVEATGTRARLFNRAGELAADSRYFGKTRQAVEVEQLPPPGSGNGSTADTLFDIYDRITRWLPGAMPLTHYREIPEPSAADYPEVMSALMGDDTRMVRAYSQDSMMLSVAVPVQRYKRILGALMLTKPSTSIDNALLDVRLDILKIFGVAIAITTFLSIYLARTIARPVKRLAAAADRVRRDHSREDNIPDFTNRNDEIGDLSLALRAMTAALWTRMDAIERFAADVAHEIKNPLTSLRSAVETAVRVKDPEQQKKLMSIIQDDVGRLDRLISDISDASRLDAELSRAHKEPVDLAGMLSTLADVHATTAEDGGPKLLLEIMDGRKLSVQGMESRLVQVFRNLIANAVTFSPPGGTIRITASRDRRTVIVTIDDEGPGIPPGKEEAIFQRFYTERPHGEKFGTHSGLGLSISQQIVDAHDGTVRASNRLAADGKILGARFTVCLPAA
ncbi:MAG: histidine kinase [Rhodospirillales bacterium CG15_BIG_FIL_POST_REV_8_21_14_020_66_15]|nr:MAG: histidine kinase [Rhodospirillales bacterium CG15_BIG_FIL_POST_REV_8_21_14_020_66_15]